MMNRFATVLVALVALSATSVNAFAFSSRTASSPVADEAVAIYAKAYPFDRAPPKKDIVGNFGMPSKLSERKPNSKSRLTDISEADARATFAEISRLYNEERALEMVKAMPICLAFNRDRFAECLDIFEERFGLEAAQDMVKRNPGLLAIAPKDAVSADDSAMAFSYIIAFTRPVGPFLLGGLLLALLTPFIEKVSGISF